MSVLGRLLRNYAQSNDQKFPFGLSSISDSPDIHPDWRSESGRFICAGANNQSADRPGTYVYVGWGISLDESPETIILYERPGAHSNWVHVLRQSGSVDTLFVQELDDEIWKSRKSATTTAN